MQELAEPLMFWPQYYLQVPFCTDTRYDHRDSAVLQRTFGSNAWAGPILAQEMSNKVAKHAGQERVEEVVVIIICLSFGYLYVII